MNTPSLGEPRFVFTPSHPVSDAIRIPERIEKGSESGLQFELAGPREKLFFDPKQTRAGIVTCGGLCPGLNNVIRSLFLELHHGYGVAEVIGFRGGYSGLDPDSKLKPVQITPQFVDGIHQKGGTILGSSRGPVDIGRAVDNLIARGINILFTVGGDGTQRGANDLYQEARRRGHALSVVGVPKTIDNDVGFVSRTFGFFTAVEEAARVLDCAHTEARSVLGGIGLVKLMGRHAGFITAGATVASQNVNFALIPEVPFELDAFLAALKQRVLAKTHAVIAVAEGAGQDLLAADAAGRDASGNVKLKDISPFLREKIEAYFKAEGIPVVMRYFDPSYQVRSRPANCEDALLCDLFARHAVHAAMAGKTGLVIGFLHERFIHVPIELLATHTKRLDPASGWWRSVLATTGQPERFGAPEKVSPVTDSPASSNHESVSDTAVLLAVNGTLMRGLKLNPNMLSAGATFVRETSTEPAYRIWTINDEHPAMIRVTDGSGVAVQVEVWSVPAAGLAGILLSEPPGLCIGKVRLADGSIVLGVLGENALVEGQQEITPHGGWRSYIKTKAN